MKLKARDIVPGWPRGRSTSAFRRLLVGVAWIGWKHRLIIEDRDQLAEDAERNRIYHERQQQMLDAFFAAWRTMPPRDPLDCTYFPSELRTFPIFMESLETMSLEDIVGHYAREPFKIAEA